MSVAFPLSAGSIVESISDRRFLKALVSCVKSEWGSLAEIRLLVVSKPACAFGRTNSLLSDRGVEDRLPMTNFDYGQIVSLEVTSNLRGCIFPIFEEMSEK
ncbi:hypothetical protein Trydic_g1899 [Trypoxylus dichotomus]